MRLTLWISTLATAATGAMLLQPGSAHQAPTYLADIAPILAKKCTGCHVKGGPGPFPLDSYAEVKKRLELIRTVSLSHIMPPFDARSDTAGFGLPSKLTDDEAVLLQEWIRAKGPRGVGIEKSAGAWQSGHSGFETILRPLQVPEIDAEGTPYWKGFILTLPRTLKNGAIMGFKVNPASPQALRYVTLYLLPSTVAKELSRGTRVYGGEVDGKYLVGVWGPGGNAFQLPSGIGYPIQTGEVLYARVCYSPAGRALDGGFSIALRSGVDPSTRTAKWVTLGEKDFVIDANKVITKSHSVDISGPARVLAILPEARYYAAGVRVKWIDNLGKTTTLFESGRWNPLWVANYQFVQPISIQSGSKLTAEVTFENDERCPMNDGKKPQPISYGMGPGNELCWVHVLLAPAGD